MTWATSTGTTVVGSLVPTTAEYDSTIVESGVTYGLIKYSFSGSPTLSGVLAGHRLTVAGFTNALNNGTFRIYDANDTDDEIRVYNTSRLSNSLNETGITGTGSVADSGAVKTEPSTAKKAQGFLTPEKPSDGIWNWLINDLYTQLTAVDKRATSVYCGPSTISSSSYADLDGAGTLYGFDGVASDQTWTASANDGAYEDVTGLNVDITTKGANDILHIATWEQNNGISRPVETQLDFASGTATYQFATSASGYADSVTQNVFSHSHAVLITSGISAATAYDFNTEAQRYTGLGTVAGRSWAIELHPQDDSSNNLVRFGSYAISEGTLNSGSYADMAGYTTGSQTFQNGNKALVIMGIPVRGSSAGANVKPTFKLLRDATDIAEWDFSVTYSVGTLDTGTMIPLGRVVDVTGAHTFKMQGYYTSDVTYYGSDNEGYFSVIELPAEYDGDTLARATDDVSSSITNTSYAELGTSGSVTTNGHNVLMMLSGRLLTTAQTDVKFKVDGADVSGEYSFNTNSREKGFCLFFFAESISAGSHTFSVDAKTASGTTNFVATQFAALEMPIADPAAGNAPEATIYSTTGKKVEVSYNGVVTATDQVSLQITENTDGGGAAADGNEYVFTPASGVETPFSFRTVVDAPTTGADVEYKLQGKTASGTAIISSADFVVRELNGDGQ